MNHTRETTVTALTSLIVLFVCWLPVDASAVTRTFCVRGTSNGQGWTWNLSGPGLPSLQVSVDGIPAGSTAADLAMHWVNSINRVQGTPAAYKAKFDCVAEGGTAYFKITALLDFEFGVDGCTITGNPEGCRFNPDVLEVPVSCPVGIAVRTVTNPTNGHVYHLLVAPDGLSGLSWTDAEAAAMALGGHLATVEDEKENAWITSTFSDAFYIWIGLNDVGREGNFAWSSGSPVTYTNWFPGEPSDSDGGEHYVHIYNFDSGFRQWNDNKNVSSIDASPVYGVAEIEPVCESVDGGNYSSRFQRVVWTSNRDGSYDIWKLDLPQAKLTQLTMDDVPTVNQHPVFTPDGDRIAFERNRDIHIMDVNGANVERLTVDGHSGHPWASFDQHIYFTRLVSDVQTLWRMDVNGVDQEQLTGTDADRIHANLRCDGKRLLYTYIPLGASAPTSIRILNIETGDDSLLYEPGWPVSAAIWHPRGEKAVLAEDPNGTGVYRLVEIEFPSGNVLDRNLTNDAANHTIPYYSYPDGRRIDWVLQPGEGRSREIWCMDADGSDKENLSRHPLEDTKIAGYEVVNAQGQCSRPPVGCNPTPPPCDLPLSDQEREDAIALGREIGLRDQVEGSFEDVGAAAFESFTESRLFEALEVAELPTVLIQAAERLSVSWLEDPSGDVRAAIAYVFVNSYLMLQETAPAGGIADCELFFDNTNVQGVVNNSPNRPRFTLRADDPSELCGLYTYHWNGGAGKVPGTISLKNLTTGRIYGPFPAFATPGQGGAPNVNWFAFPSPRVQLRPGEYEVVDSDNATWSWNAASLDDRQQRVASGFAKVWLKDAL